MVKSPMCSSICEPVFLIKKLLPLVSQLAHLLSKSVPKSSQVHRTYQHPEAVNTEAAIQHVIVLVATVVKLVLLTLLTFL